MLTLVGILLTQCCSPTKNVTAEDRELDRERRTLEIGLPERRMSGEFYGNLTKTQLDSMITVDCLDTIAPVKISFYKPYFQVQTNYTKITDSVTYRYTVVPRIKDSLYRVTKRSE